jgi:hypothetical protein
VGIDIDYCKTVDGETVCFEDAWIRELKALYQYNMIPREVKHTRHGIHVYLKLDFNKLTWEQILNIRRNFGDDPYRLFWDEIKAKRGFWVNRLFTSSEVEEWL